MCVLLASDGSHYLILYSYHINASASIRNNNAFRIFYSPQISIYFNICENNISRLNLIYFIPYL